jgi:hypothetical protein
MLGRTGGSGRSRGIEKGGRCEERLLTVNGFRQEFELEPRDDPGGPGTVYLGLVRSR